MRQFFILLFTFYSLLSVGQNFSWLAETEQMASVGFSTAFDGKNLEFTVGGRNENYISHLTSQSPQQPSALKITRLNDCGFPQWTYIYNAPPVAGVYLESQVDGFTDTTFYSLLGLGNNVQHLLKLDTSGQVIWAKRISLPSTINIIDSELKIVEEQLIIEYSSQYSTGYITLSLDGELIKTNDISFIETLSLRLSYVDSNRFILYNQGRIGMYNKDGSRQWALNFAPDPQDQLEFTYSRENLTLENYAIYFKRKVNQNSVSLIRLNYSGDIIYQTPTLPYNDGCAIHEQEDQSMLLFGIDTSFGYSAPKLSCLNANGTMRWVKYYPDTLPYPTLPHIPILSPILTVRHTLYGLKLISLQVLEISD